MVPLSLNTLGYACRGPFGCPRSPLFRSPAEQVLEHIGRDPPLAVTLMRAAQGWLPLWLAAAIVARDLVIVAGALAYHCVVGRYDMAPSALSKLNTGVEFLVLALVLAGAAGALETAPLRPLMFALLLATIVVSGTHYVWTWGRRARSRYRERHRASRH